MDILSLLDTTIVKIIVVILIAIILNTVGSKLVGVIIRRLVRHYKFETQADRQKREDTVSNIFSATVGFIIWLVATGAILKILDFDLGSIAAGAGFIGIIIGIGAQATIKDYLAGIGILMENQYRVGDIVTLSGGNIGGTGTSGVVEQITLRITKLRDLDGTLNIIRNGEASVVTNRTFIYSSVIIDIGVTYNTDIDEVERIMNEVGKNMMHDNVFKDEINEPITFLRVDDFTEAGILIKAVGTVKPALQWEVAGEYRRRLLKAFAKHHISMATPRLIIEQK